MSFSDETPPPLMGGGWGVGEVGNGLPTRTFPLSLSLSRQGRGDFLYSALLSPDHAGHGPVIFFQTRFLPLPGSTCQEEHEGRAQTSGSAGEEPFCCFSFFFCVPKRRNKKKAPQPVLALRASLASRRERDAKKLGLRPQTVLAFFPAPVCEARQDKWGRVRLPLARSRAPERLPKRGFALFERSEFAKPRQHRGAQGIPPAAGQVTRVPFLWFVSLGKQRNEQTNFP